MNVKFYPLQFQPILKERIWGGEKLKTVLHKPITSEITGESWELSAVEGESSCIVNGVWKGKFLTEIINDYPNEILGRAVYNRFGKQFPLLFKYLDAREDLSVQVHPDDALAKKRHNSFGKTEMWYIIQADEESKIIVGFKEKSNKALYLESIKNHTLLSLLEEIKVKEGDAFFLESGTVHALGAGLLVAEIQQTSDVTYRIYDFDRVDAQGNKRELHIDLSVEAINYNKVDVYKKYDVVSNQSYTIVDCPYFTTKFLALDGETTVLKAGNTFTVYMCVKGVFELEYNNEKFHYKKGDTILIPAAIKLYVLNGSASLLDIFIS